MKALFFFSIIIFGGGDWVGNSLGHSERMIQLAFENLDIYLVSSLKDSKQPLSTEQKFIVKKILDSLAMERRNPNLLQFRRDSNEFWDHGKHRIAITGTKVGDSIAFNRDLLFSVGPDNSHYALTLLQAVSLLVHQLGYHQGVYDDIFLDHLGTAVATANRFDSQWLPLRPGEKIGAQVVSMSESLAQTDTLALVDSDKFLDLSHILQNDQLCSTFFRRDGDLVSLHYWNAHWESPLGEGPKLVLYLSTKCRFQDGQEQTRNGDVLAIETNTIAYESKKLFSQKLVYRLSPCLGSSKECEQLMQNPTKRRIL